MNTIEIVEEWSQFQDEGSIDWSDMPINQSVEYNDERVGLRAEFQQPLSGLLKGGRGFRYRLIPEMGGLGGVRCCRAQTRS